MAAFVSELISSVIQIILFALVPFLWWLVTARKKTGFFHWIGLKWDRNKKHNKISVWIICTFIGFWIVGEFSLYALKDIPTAVSAFSGAGFGAIPAIIVYAVFHTSLSEEILFRGFLLKRISGRFGFTAGNTVQALLFGLLHGIMFVSEAGFLKAILLTVFTAAIAWTMGYINEKKADGSILPGWLIHGAVSYTHLDVYKRQALFTRIGQPVRPIPGPTA